MPYRDRKVICGSSAIRWPGTSRIRHRRASVAIVSTACIQAKPSPIHCKLPPPNGKYENFGRAAAASGVQRSGSNRSGSGKYRASRCVTNGLTCTYDPLRITKPFIFTSRTARRVMSQTGGYSRIDSAKTIRVYRRRSKSCPDGSRSPRTRSTSLCNFVATSGFSAIKYHAHIRPVAGVSLPTMKNVSI